MRKEEICNMDCLHCVHPDCINDETLTRQARYYWRHRERVLEKKKRGLPKEKGGEGWRTTRKCRKTSS